MDENLKMLVELEEMARRECGIPGLPALGVKKLWLWKNGDHFLAFDNEYPCVSPGGDPMVLGEPVGYAILTPSFSRDAAQEDDDLCAIQAIVGPTREGQTLAERVEEFLREKDYELSVAKQYAKQHLAHVRCLKAATLDESLHITIRTRQNGQGFSVEKVISLLDCDRVTPIGDAVHLTVDVMMFELSEALAGKRG